MSSRRQPYVVLGGPLASGKTTLARHLADRLGAKPIFEQFASHPLIDDFYRDPKKYGLQAEMIFTIMHYHDIAKALKDGTFDSPVVSDLFFDGTEAYTSYTLEADDRKAFIHLLRSLQAKTPVPTLVIYLDASTEFLMERVKGRGREYEKPITFEYIDGVNAAFKSFIGEYRRAPVSVLDAEKLYGMGVEAAAREVFGVVKKRHPAG